MFLFTLEPEVAGEFGDNTVFNKDGTVKYLHYVFFGWLGDDLLESTPCFLVNTNVQHEFKVSSLKGCSFQEVEITINEEFLDATNGEIILPSFVQLIPQGTITICNNNGFSWSGDDFCLSDKNYLVVTKEALETLEKFNIKNCKITPLFLN